MSNKPYKSIVTELLKMMEEKWLGQKSLEAERFQFEWYFEEKVCGLVGNWHLAAGFFHDG